MPEAWVRLGGGRGVLGDGTVDCCGGGVTRDEEGNALAAGRATAATVAGIEGGREETANLAAVLGSFF